MPVETTLFIGPQTIIVGKGATADGTVAGDWGVCQSYTVGPAGNFLPMGCTIGGTPLTLTPGTANFDTIALTLVDVFTTTTTTNTDLLTKDWELIGVAAAAAPEPPAWPLLAAGLLGMAWLRRKCRVTDG